MVQVVWTKIALNDLRNIYDFIGQDSLRYARIQIEKIQQRTLILKKSPLAGKMTPETNRKEIRELIEGNYRIIYKIENPSKIKILVIHHGARNFTKNRIE